MTVTRSTVPFLLGAASCALFLAGLSAIASAQSLYRNWERSVRTGEIGTGEGKSTIQHDPTIGALDLGFLATKNGVGMRLGFLMARVDDFTFGYEGLYLQEEREGAVRDFHLHRFSFYAYFLEFWHESFLRAEGGFAMGEHLYASEAIQDFDIGLSLLFPFWMGGDGWPIMRWDTTVSACPAGFQDHNLIVFSRLTAHLIGGFLRRLGLVAGVMFGWDDKNEFQALQIGLAWGSPL